MQELTLSWNYQDFLQRSATVYDYWLYSQTHHLPSAGRRYKMVTWLVADEEVMGEVQMTIERLLTAPLEVSPGTAIPATSSAYSRPVTTGKYELTVGPHTWSSYASSSDLSATQAQGTTCSCGVNALDWQEQHASRLGMFGRKFWEQQLPFYCGNGVKLLPGGAELEDLLLETELHSASTDKLLYRAPFKHQDHGFTPAPADRQAALSALLKSPQSSACISKPKIAQKTSAAPKQLDLIEWSGLFQLEYGKRYYWTWHGYREAAKNTFRYPDAAVDVLLVEEEGVTCGSSTATTAVTGVTAYGSVQYAPLKSITAVFDGTGVDKYDGDVLDFGRTMRLHLNSTLKEESGGIAAMDVYTQPMDPSVPAGPRRGTPGTYADRHPHIERGHWYHASVDTTWVVYKERNTTTSTSSTTSSAANEIENKYYFVSMYTQHRPEEFMAAWLQETEEVTDSSGVVRKVLKKNIFPVAEQIYDADGVWEGNLPYNGTTGKCVYVPDAAQPGANNAAGEASSASSVMGTGPEGKLIFTALVVAVLALVVGGRGARL
eukprot:g20110.t1